ncbi:MAG: hypothetical protein K2Q18_11740 [Bdellovibrionales bacterium]|nr:hypothetical protein [Bdellovibrionales bacterium]
MSTITIRKLTQEKEMKQYAQGYWNSFDGKSTKSIHPLNPEIMLSRYDNVFGVFNDKSELVGGFIVNKSPIRCFDGLSPQEIHNITYKLDGIENCGELVSIWKKRGQKGFSTKVWPTIIIESMKIKKPYIVGSVYVSNKIKETYSVLNPHLMTSVGEHNPLEIFYYERSRLIGTFFANAMIRSSQSVIKAFVPNFAVIRRL